MNRETLKKKRDPYEKKQSIRFYASGTRTPTGTFRDWAGSAGYKRGIRTMCIRAIHNQSALNTGVGVDHCVLNAIDSLHREYLLRVPQSPGNEFKILCSENSAILRTSWIMPHEWQAELKQLPRTNGQRPFQQPKGSRLFRHFPRQFQQIF